MKTVKYPKSKFKLTKSETNQLTPSFLEWFCGLGDSPSQREIKQSRVDFLADKVEGEAIVPFHWAVANLKGKLFKVNGHHSFLMLSKLPSLDPNWLVHYDEFDVMDDEGLASIYRQFDARQSTRTTLDIAAAY